MSKEIDEEDMIQDSFLGKISDLIDQSHSKKYGKKSYRYAIWSVIVFLGVSVIFLYPNDRFEIFTSEIINESSWHYVFSSIFQGGAAFLAILGSMILFHVTWLSKNEKIKKLKVKNTHYMTAYYNGSIALFMMFISIIVALVMIPLYNLWVVRIFFLPVIVFTVWSLFINLLYIWEMITTSTWGRE